MGLWQILKGEQPGLLKSVLHYRNAGQFGEYLIDYALQSNGIEGERVVLTNLYLPMKGKTTEIDLLMLHEKGIFVIESKYYSGWIFGSEDQFNGRSASETVARNTSTIPSSRTARISGHWLSTCLCRKKPFHPMSYSRNAAR